MTEDFELGHYVHALEASSNRIRYLIFALIVVTLIVFVAFRQGKGRGWTNSRAKLMREAVAAKVWEPGVQKNLTNCMGVLEKVQQRPDYAANRKAFEREVSNWWGFEDCKKFNYVVSMMGLNTQKAVEGWLDDIEEARIENVFIMRMPFLGTPFDVNDLGIFSGLTFMVLLLTLLFASARQYENLYLSLWKVRELAREEDGHDAHGRANLLYHALSMTQLFTTPPSLARWKTSGSDYIPKVLLVLPLLMQAWVVYNDRLTDNLAISLNETALLWGRRIEHTSLALIFIATVGCILYGIASDRQWKKAFFIVNPLYRRKIQPRWLEWMSLCRSHRTPGWGIAVDARLPRRHVYVTNLEAAKVWQITEEPGKPAVPPKVVATRRCRELWLASDGALYGDDLPRKEAESLRVWRLDGTGRPADDDLGWGILRCPDGYAYALEGRGGAPFLARRRISDGKKGRLSRVAGGRRGILDGEKEDAGFLWLHAVTLGPDDAFYVTDAGCIRRITRLGVVSTVGGLPIGAASRYPRSRLLGLAVSKDHGIFAADFDLRQIWQIAWDGESPAMHAEPKWRNRWLWSPAGVAVAGDDLYILEHRPDTILGILLSWAWTRSRVRKVDLKGSGKPVVLARLGRRSKAFAVA
ncbi:MAG TPA: hypothetical protein VN493_24660 [Thermoanaerobaculia bacterium]|nr:hypothetical protein [Thermoanaerobaculia bacterium]